MRNIALKLVLITSVIVGSIFMNACDEGYTINTKKMIQDEQDLMDEYLKQVEDTLAEMGDTINKMEEQGYLFFELEEGTGDSVEIGKKVGYRYVYYQIARDSTDVATLYAYESNYRSEKPVTYTVGAPNAYDGIYEGIDLAIRNMKMGAKARVFITSSLWNNDYNPRAVDIEITYLEK